MWLDTPWLIITILIPYLLGSIPFGLLFALVTGAGDPRKIGSGNIGATNILRTGKKGIALLTLICDSTKGILAVWLTTQLFNDDITPAVAGFFVVIGHIFPIWLRFYGGKGVATTLGVIAVLNIQIAIVVCTIWLLTFLTLRIASVASMIAIAFSPAAAQLLGDNTTGLLCFFLAALILFTHRGNIQRLTKGTEHNFDRYRNDDQ